MKELVRRNILNIVPYEAGKPIEEIKRQLALKEVIKLASNENPLGPSPKAVQAIKKNLKIINRYPDSQGFYLKRKLAKFLNVQPLNIVLGNGSDELIDIIIKTFVGEDENIITADVTFLEYEIISKVNGRQIVRVPLKYFKYDLDAIKKKLDRKTKVIFISNPNNPTGTYVTRYELEEFMAGLPQDLLLVLDEAYDTFIDVNDFPNSLSYIRGSTTSFDRLKDTSPERSRGTLTTDTERPFDKLRVVPSEVEGRSRSARNKNVIVLKTFSKGYGLAGLRIGYAVTKSEIAFYMDVARQPFNVNALAQVAAMAALDDKKFLERTRETILKGKQYLYDALTKLGIAYVPSVSNFILIDVGRDGVEVFKAMLKYGVITRDMKQYGLKNFIRVTIGTERENKRFIKVLKKVL